MTLTGVQWGAEFTRWVTAPWILLLIPTAILVNSITGIGPFPELDGSGLEQAGRYPGLVWLPALVDGLTHAVVFVTALTAFAVLRTRWPVRSAALLVFGALQMLFGMAKAVTSGYIATGLGAAYLSADAAARASFLPAGIVAGNLRTGLQDMDTYAVVVLVLLFAVLPRPSRIPRAVRIIGPVIAVALSVADPLLSLVGVHDAPTFFLVIVLFPPYFFILGTWLKRKASMAPGGAEI